MRFYRSGGSGSNGETYREQSVHGHEKIAQKIDFVNRLHNGGGIDKTAFVIFLGSSD